MSRARLSSTAIAWGVCALLFGLATLHTHSFASSGHLAQLLVFASFVGFAAMGQTLVIIGGGIDLSVPWMMALGGIQMTAWTGGGMPSGVAIAAIVAIGALIGAANGLGVTALGIPPIVMTIGTGGLVEGYLVHLGVGAGDGLKAPAAAATLVSTHVAGIPLVALVWAVVAAGLAVLLRRTAFGRSLYAAGANDAVATLAGVHVAAVRCVAYAASAATATFAGVLLAGYVGQSYLDMGAPYLFSSIAAIAVGGASILGGTGNYWGTMAGAATLTVLTALLPLLNLSDAALDVVYGLVILLGVLVGRLAGRQAGTAGGAR